MSSSYLIITVTKHSTIRVFYAIVLCLLPLIGNSQTTKRQVGEKPNFVLIVADDLGFADLSMHGSRQIKTPHIDRLADQGVNFKEGYVSSPVCSPSRAGFLTGRNQVSFGHDNNLAENQPGFDPQFRGLPLTEKTIADHLTTAGYVNGLIGKWHLGYEPQFHPLKRGFQEFWGYTGGGHDYFESLPNGKGYKAPIECNYKTPSPITYITDDVGDECVEFINRNHERPFFLFASFNAPHAPMQAAEEDLRLYEHIQDQKRRTYAAMVHRLDVNIGKIVKALETQQISDNTMIVFISDNGGPVNSNGSINAPYNGQKGILLEGGIHVPFIMSWPGKIPIKSEFHDAVSALDIAPTFVALAGVQELDEQVFDGVDLLPHILDRSSDAPHESLMWRFTISAAIRQDQWKLIRLPDRLPLLFDLSKDISEQHNVALEQIDVTKELLKKIGDWDVALPHPVFLEGAIWKRRQLDLYDMSYPLTQPN